MIKKTFFIVLLLFLIFITACTNDEPPAADDVAIVYCSNYYDASYGEIGYFTITPFEDIELETKYDDLSSFKLGEAFSNMLIKEIRLNEDGYSIDVCVIGELTTGKYGTFEGNGLVKNKNVKVNVPINEAFAVSDSIIYSNFKEQTVVIDLWSTCFKKELTVADFVLSGAAEDMQIKEIEFENYEKFDEKFYPQTVILTLTGDPNGLSYAYIDILDAAITYNEDIRVVINTDFYGGTILNENIDTYTNYDTVYVELNNLTFKSDLEITDIELDGVLKDYAVIAEIELLKENLIAISLSFPYTFINTYDNIGYIKFSSNTNNENIEFVCTSIVVSPSIDYDVTINNDEVKMKLELENGEFNVLDFYPFNLYYSNGEKILVTNLSIINIDGYLEISFKLPDISKKIIYFELENAYEITNVFGVKENKTIKTILYLN